jgi:hypothetical protein
MMPGALADSTINSSNSGVPESATIVLLFAAMLAMSSCQRGRLRQLIFTTQSSSGRLTNFFWSMP